ncbi:MAG: HAD family hydrolase [Polyangiaceae bacterium]|nr:HAD family hydrolase [Polyangiaceae bacterium]
MVRAGDRALFLDRDGTLIHDVGYPRDPDAVELLHGAARALGVARELGFKLVIVSNQSGVARGVILPSEANAVQARVEALFACEGICFDGAWFCFHGPDDACDCRKPLPKLILDAALTLGIDLRYSITIGDKPSDIEAGVAAGTRAVMFGNLEHPLAEATFARWDDLEHWIRSKS